MCTLRQEILETEQISAHEGVNSKLIANEPAERRREAGEAAALSSRVREFILVQGYEISNKKVSIR